MNLRTINISFLITLLASFSYALPQYDLDPRTQSSIDGLRSLPADAQSAFLAMCITSHWNKPEANIPHNLYEAGFRLEQQEAFELLNLAIMKRKGLDTIREALAYTREPLTRESTSKLLENAVSVGAIDVAQHLIELGAHGEFITLKSFTYALSSRDSCMLAEKISTLPLFSYERIFSVLKRESNVPQGRTPSPEFVADAEAYVTALTSILQAQDIELLNVFLKHSPDFYFTSSWGTKTIARMAMAYPDRAYIELLAKKGIDFKVLIQYDNWLGEHKKTSVPPIQHLISFYFGTHSYARIQTFKHYIPSFEHFVACLQYLLNLEGANNLTYGTPADILVNWLYSYRNRVKNHPITPENYREVIRLLRAQINDIIMPIQNADKLPMLLKAIQEPDIRAMLTQDSIDYLEKSIKPEANHFIDKPRQERRKLQQEFDKHKKSIVTLIGILKTILSESQKLPAVASAVAASSSVRARPTARQRALSPEQVRVKQPQGFAAQSALERAKQSTVLAQTPCASCGDAAAASSSNIHAVTETVFVDPLAEARETARAARLQAAERLADEQRRAVSRESRYRAEHDHALLPLENQPARASSVTRPARSASASHSRDTTPLDKRDATPQLRPLMLVKDFKTLKAYYDVLEQSGNEGAFSNFKSLLKKLGSPETFWGVFQDFKQITGLPQTAESVKFIEFKLNKKLRVYFKVTADNKLVLVGDPHHLQSKKNN